MQQPSNAKEIEEFVQAMKEMAAYAQRASAVLEEFKKVVLFRERML